MTNEQDYITIRNGDDVRRVPRAQYMNDVRPASVSRIEPEENPLATVSHAVSALTSQQLAHGSHARSDDSAIAVSEAHVMASKPILAVHAVITAGIMIIGTVGLWWALGASWGTVAATIVLLAVGLIVWGKLSLNALDVSRRQSLENTPAGIAKTEIDRKYDSADNIVREHYAYLRDRDRRIYGDESSK